jgi:hypothetical protein
MTIVHRSAALAILALPACFGNEATNFPPGIRTLEANTISDPAGTPGDPFPEALSLQAGSTSTWDLVHARGFVHAPLGVVWSAFQDPDVVVDRRNITSYTATKNVESGYDVSFQTHYVIKRIITLEFDLTWRQSAISHPPMEVAIAYQKTEGSTLVDLMEGAIILSTRTSTLTELSIVQHLKATATSPADIESWTRDMFASVVARAHGEPLPRY